MKLKLISVHLGERVLCDARVWVCGGAEGEDCGSPGLMRGVGADVSGGGDLSACLLSEEERRRACS